MEHTPDKGVDINGDIPFCNTHHPSAKLLRIKEELTVKFQVRDFADVLTEPGQRLVPEERSRPVDVEETGHFPSSCTEAGTGRKRSIVRGEAEGGSRRF
jgi:hypothetical protein